MQTDEQSGSTTAHRSARQRSDAALGLPLLEAPERVLSTLNRDGSRRWLRPRVSRGRFLVARQIVAYLLIAIFTLIPHIQINGKPAMLLDVVHRQFTLFGATFLPTDTVLLALFMLGVFVSIFLFTALFGRVWCGWACPQTVYLEFLFRPIQRLFEGTAGRGGQPGGRRAGWRMVAMYLVFALFSLFLAHTFLAYFVGVEALETWVRRSPLEHPGSFLVMAATTGLMMFNFCYFREQTCVLACPYGRFQSALLDRNSLIISYDAQRGEPRRKMHRESAAGNGAAKAGDCIDCTLCVTTCPTGIDIRNGLQLECVGCAQCIDACDAVMDKVGRPRGLIRYTSEARLRGERGRLFRGRIAIYCTVLLVVVTALSSMLVTKPTADVEVLRGLGLPYSVLPDGSVANPLRVKLTNRGEHTADYQLSIEGVDSAELRFDPNPIHIEPGGTYTASGLIVRPRGVVGAESVECSIRVRDGQKFDHALAYKLLGPPPSSGGGGKP